MTEQDAQEARTRVRRFFLVEKIPLPFRRIVVGMLGGTICVVGIIMIVTPGPAIVFIPLGLVLLASEFKWAERWHHQANEHIVKARARWSERNRNRIPHPSETVIHESIKESNKDG